MNVWKIFYMGNPKKPTLYAMTDSKKVLNAFKKQRNMDKFVVNKSEEDEESLSLLRDKNIRFWLSLTSINTVDYDGDGDIHEVKLALTNSEFDRISMVDELFDMMIQECIHHKNYHNYFKPKYYDAFAKLGYTGFKELQYLSSGDDDNDFIRYYGANDSEYDFSIETDLDDVNIDGLNYFTFLYEETLS